MTPKAQLLAAIVADPDSDGPRLVYADYLDDHGRPERAELIRVQCALEPVRDRYDLPHAAALHRREDELLGQFGRTVNDWLGSLIGRDPDPSYPLLVYRRGFVHQARLPAPVWVEHGAAVRRRFPLLRSLRVHRLAGWSRRLAACESLAGLTALELACWYGPEVLELAMARHLHGVETVRLWLADRVQLEAAVAFGRLLPALRRTELVDMTPTGLGRELVGHFRVGLSTTRVQPTVEDRSDWLFPFAADCSPDCYPGRLADGRLFFGCHTDAGMHAQTFTPAGGHADWLRLPPPPAGDRRDVERWLGRLIGFTPDFIRVPAVRLADPAGWPRWWPADQCDGFGEPDDPRDWPPQPGRPLNGNGEDAARRWDERAFAFGDGRGDKSGQLHPL